MMPWRGLRDDRKHVTADVAEELDWITHADAVVYYRFMASVFGVSVLPPAKRPDDLIKLNFGCGSNRLPGWENHDAEVDIASPLPFPDSHAHFIFAEHCVEHIDYYAALAFFKECRRILKPGGVLRLAIPSIENVWKRGDQEYCNAVRRWARKTPACVVPCMRCCSRMAIRRRGRPRCSRLRSTMPGSMN